jgi:nitrogen regulatory protein PII
VFSNWIPFRRQIEHISLVERRNIIIDLSNAQLVDHSVMGKLEEMERDFVREGLRFEVRGLDTLQPFTDNAQAARKGGLATVRRITIIAEAELEQELEEEFIALGATGYTTINCTGAGRRAIAEGKALPEPYVRIEVLVPNDVCESIITFLRREMLPQHSITACVETVDVVRIRHFTSEQGEETYAETQMQLL